MQRRFLKITFARNLYDETERALQKVDLTWSDVEWIKLNGQLVNLEDFKTITELIKFKPFEKDEKTKGIIISFRNGSQMIKAFDKNYRYCYCFYDANNNKDSEDLEKEFGKDYIKIRLVPNIFEATTDGKDKHDLYFRAGIDKIEFEHYKHILPDSQAVNVILRKNKGNFIKPEEDEIAPCYEMIDEEEENLSIPNSSNNPKDIENAINELKDSLSEEELENLDENELKNNLIQNGKFGFKQPVEEYVTDEKGCKERTTIYDDGSSTDISEYEDNSDGEEDKSKVIEEYIPGEYYINGDTIQISGENKTEVSSKEIITSVEEGYDADTITFYKETKEINYSYVSTRPVNPIKLIFPDGLILRDEKGNIQINDLTYNALDEEQKRMVDHLIKEGFQTTICKGGTLRTVVINVHRSGPYTRVVPKN